MVFLEPTIEEHVINPFGGWLNQIFNFSRFNPFRGIVRISGRLKNYQVSEKIKLSQELKTFVGPKWDRLVPIYRGPIDPILEGCSKILFEIILFFRKKSCRKWPKSAIFRYFLQYKYICKNTKLHSNDFICINFAWNDLPRVNIAKIRPFDLSTRFSNFELCETKMTPRARNASYAL